MKSRVGSERWRSRVVCFTQLDSAPLVSLIAESRIIVCAGSGGVGKTTTAAAVAIAAARSGRRVLALTIDPAERLIRSLGLGERPDQPTAIALPGTTQGSLHVVIHDSKRTFDGLVKKHSPSAEAASRILDNPLYQQLSTKLAGVGEYMAIERLFELQQGDRFDLIVLDTPPTRNAFDFLTAPERLRAALHSGAGRIFVRAFAAPPGTQRGLLRRGVARALEGIGRITSSVFLQQFATLLYELDQVFVGLSARSIQLSSLLTTDDVLYLVVSSPKRLALEESRFFLDHLASAGTARGVLLVNRVRSPVPDAPPVSELMHDLARLGIALGEDAARRFEQVLVEEQRAAQADQARVAEVKQMAPLQRLIAVPELRREAHDLPGLIELSELLLQT